MSDPVDDAERVACKLDADGRERRAERLREELFPLLDAVEDVEDGYALAFAGEDALDPVTEHVRREAECCPFARYEVTIEPYAETIEVRITGEGVETMIEDGMEHLIDGIEDVSFSG